MFSVYTPTATDTELVGNIYIETGDPLPALTRVARLVLPEYAANPSFADEAIRQGSGNCFAHSEVLAGLAEVIPGTTPLISLSRSAGSRILHAECVVVTGEHRIVSVDMAHKESEPVLRGYTADYVCAETRAFQLLRGAQHLTSFVVRGAKSGSAWQTTRGRSLAAVAPEASAPTPRVERLVMTPDIGIPALHAISVARRLWRSGSLEAYNEHCTMYAHFLPHFDVRPSGVSHVN